MKRIKQIFFSFVKHIFLLYLTSVIAVFLLPWPGFLFRIKEVFSSEVIISLLVIGAIAMLLVAVPYLICLFIAKKIIKTSSMWSYVVSGAIVPIPIHALALSQSIQFELADLLVSLAYVAIGAFCGFIYGILDKKISKKYPTAFTPHV